MFDTLSEWNDFNLKASDYVPLPKLERTCSWCGCCDGPSPRFQRTVRDLGDVRGGGEGVSSGGEGCIHELGPVEGQREQSSLLLSSTSQTLFLFSEPITYPRCFLPRGTSVCLHTKHILLH